MEIAAAHAAMDAKEAELDRYGYGGKDPMPSDRIMGLDRFVPKSATVSTGVYGKRPSSKCSKCDHPDYFHRSKQCIGLNSDPAGAVHHCTCMKFMNELHSNSTGGELHEVKHRRVSQSVSVTYDPLDIKYDGIPLRMNELHSKVSVTYDPLDIKYDGIPLRMLLREDERSQREYTPNRYSYLTPTQRAAVSAHWSAELRARVAASKERERVSVVLDIDAEDL